MNGALRLIRECYNAGHKYSKRPAAEKFNFERYEHDDFKIFGNATGGTLPKPYNHNADVVFRPTDVYRLEKRLRHLSS